MATATATKSTAATAATTAAEAVDAIGKIIGTDAPVNPPTISDALAKAKVTGAAATAATAALNANVRLASTKGELTNLAKGMDAQYGDTVTLIAKMLEAGVTTRAAETLFATVPGAIKVSKSTVSNYSTVAAFVALPGALPKVKGKDGVERDTHILRPTDEHTPKGVKSVYAAILKGIMPGDAKAAADAAGIKYGKPVVAAIIASSKDKAEAVQGLDALAKTIADAKAAADAAAKDPKNADVLVKSAAEGILAGALKSAKSGFVGDKVELAAQIKAAQAVLIALEAYAK